MNEHAKLGSYMQNCWSRNALKKNEGERRRDEEKKSGRGNRLKPSNIFLYHATFTEN